MSDVKYVDLDTGLARVRGNRAIYKKMLELFIKSGEFAAFEEAVGQQNWVRGAEVAHAIKGMTGNLSLDAVFQYSTSLMEQMRHGAPDAATLESYRSALEATKAEVERLLPQLA